MINVDYRVISLIWFYIGIFASNKRNIEEVRSVDWDIHKIVERIKQDLRKEDLFFFAIAPNSFTDSFTEETQKIILTAIEEYYNNAIAEDNNNDND